MATKPLPVKQEPDKTSIIENSAPEPRPEVSKTVTIDKDLQNSLASLAHKHVHVSYVIVGIAALLIVAMCVAGWYATKIYGMEVERAEAAQKAAAVSEQLIMQYKLQSDEEHQQFLAQLAANEAARRASAQRIANLENQIADLRTQLAKTLSNILAPGKTAREAYDDASAHYPTLKSPFASSKSAEGNEQLTFLVPDVQQFTAAKVRLDEADKELVIKDSQLGEAKSSLALFQADLNRSRSDYSALQQTYEQCDRTVKDKNVAIDKANRALHRGKWQRFRDGAIKVGLAVGGALIGHAL